MTMKYAFWLLLIAFTFVQCKKKELTFTLEGKVTDATFNTALVGAKIELIQISVAGAAPNKTLGTAEIGSDGRYSFTFDRNKADSYTVKITKDLYFSIEESIQFASFTTDKPLEKNFSTTAKSWAKFRFVNQEPADEFDGVELIKTGGKSNCLECCSNQSFTFYGTGENNFTCINDGNTQIQYYYSILGTTTQEFVDVITVPFDTVEKIIYY